MRWSAIVLVIGLGVAAAGAAVFERFLSQDRPEDRAILAYMAIDEAGKASSDDLADLGVLLLHKGFPKDAERYLERAVKLDKENAEARYRLGLVLQRQGEYGKAIRQYRKVAKLRPGHAYSRFMLALAEERAGHRDEAVYDYAKAYKHAPELADPAKNPLVLDSKLQVEAQLLRYQREVESDTIDVGPINPEAVREMMSARQPEPAPVQPAVEMPSRPVAGPEAAPDPAQAAPPAETGVTAAPTRPRGPAFADPSQRRTDESEGARRSGRTVRPGATPTPSPTPGTS